MTKLELLDKILIIKNETLPKANSAVRVGQMFEDIVNNIDSLVNTNVEFEYDRFDKSIIIDSMYKKAYYIFDALTLDVIFELSPNAPDYFTYEIEYLNEAGMLNVSKNKNDNNEYWRFSTSIIEDGYGEDNAHLANLSYDYGFLYSGSTGTIKITGIKHPKTNKYFIKVSITGITY